MAGGLLIALALTVLGGLAGAALLLRPPPTDPDTLCRTDLSLAAHTVVLVDGTDRLEPRHRRKLRAVLAQERARLSQFDRLTVMRLNARRPQEPARLFSLCLPQPPGRANPLFENGRMARQRWEEDFGAVLDAAARSAGTGGRGSASPLIASIRAAAADPEFGADIPTRRLVIVSDLLEHDPGGFSLYQEGADFARWRTQSPFGPPDLSTISVRVALLDRPEHAQRQAQAAQHFWPAFLNAAGAQSPSFDPAP